jgi:hypothetical protein
LSHWYSCRCPAHNDRHASLSLLDTPHGLIAKCFVCRDVQDVHAAIRVVMRDQPPRSYPTPPPVKPIQVEVDRIIARILDGSAPSAGTLLEQYIRGGRGIAVELPPTLRYHPALWHAETRTRGPAMVALVQAANGDPVSAIHRTWLAADGLGKAAVDPPRKSFGPLTGHAVHLGRPSSRLILGEGVETTLSALQLWGPSFDAWATLSTSGMVAVMIPDTVTEIVIAADNEDAGRKAAAALRDRLRRENPSRPVSAVTPKHGVNDFNDVLRARVAT